MPKRKNYKPKFPSPLTSDHKSELNANSSPAPGQLGRETPPLITFRPYQSVAFHNKTDGIQIWLWGRQTGKSFTLAAWAVDRLITNPGRTVTMLSNSKFNGIELNRKCAEVCRLMGQAFEQVDLSPDNRFENMNCETRILVSGRVGRILVLAANPRTARGFSGDLILDEFAFHEDSSAIWTAAQPILAANRDYLCRIASTPNGKHNQFYRLATDRSIPILRVTRTDAHAQGCPIYHPVTREPITPAEARAIDPNKRAYDQNFECVFEDENMTLLTYDLINAAERSDVGVICEGQWSAEAISVLATPLNCATRRKTARDWINEATDELRMQRHLLMNVCNGSIDRMDHLLHSNCEIGLNDIYDPDWTPQDRDFGRRLFVGVDVGRHNDLTVISVVERTGNVYQVRAMLRLHGTRLPQQQQRLEEILRVPGIRAAKIDMTGLGLGLFEYTQEKFPDIVHGINFSTSVPVSSLPQNAQSSVASAGNSSVRVTEALATQLLQVFEDRAIQIPIDADLRDDLRKPERLISPSGRVSIAATRSEAGHADHFWSLALAINAAQTPIPPPFWYHSWLPRARMRCTTL